MTQDNEVKAILDEIRRFAEPDYLETLSEEQREALLKGLNDASERPPSKIKGRDLPIRSNTRL